MVMLKQVSLRLKSISNISKITKTMKMVSASKFTRAERELKAARPFGYGPRKFYESSQLVIPPKKGDKEEEVLSDKPKKSKDNEGEEDKKQKYVLIAMTSDRGLCGGVHSGVARRIRLDLAAATKTPDPTQIRLVCIGDKSRSMLRRQFSKIMLLSMKDVGRRSPTFNDAALMAGAVAESGFGYDTARIYYNKYFSPVKYELSIVPAFTKVKIEEAPNINAFDELEDDMLVCYAEWTLMALLYYAMKESAASEQSARMAAMDNATKNASDMIRKLQLLFNRTRQAVITRELIEIISGASALK